MGYSNRCYDTLSVSCVVRNGTPDEIVKERLINEVSYLLSKKIVESGCFTIEKLDVSDFGFSKEKEYVFLLGINILPGAAVALTSDMGEIIDTYSRIKEEHPEYLMKYKLLGKKREDSNGI